MQFQIISATNINQSLHKVHNRFIWENNLIVCDEKIENRLGLLSLIINKEHKVKNKGY